MSKDKFPRLENCDPLSCIAGRINACERVINNIYRKCFLPFDLTISQFTILMMVNKMGEVRQVDISSFLIMDKSTVNRNLKRLLSKKLLVMQEGKELSISRAGKVKLESILPEWEKAQKECKEKLKGEGVAALGKLYESLFKEEV